MNILSISEKICELQDYLPFIETSETGHFKAFTVCILILLNNIQNKKAFQSNVNQLLSDSSDSLFFIVNKFEYVQGFGPWKEEGTRAGSLYRDSLFPPRTE